jgi:hypothetical protein
MGFLKGLLYALAGKSIQNLIDIAKAELVIALIRALGGLRKLIVLTSLWVFLLMLMAGGLVIVPVALCVYMPWGSETKLIVLLSFAAVYIGVPLIALMSVLSERRWLKLFKVDELVAKVVRKRESS